MLVKSQVYEYLFNVEIEDNFKSQLKELVPMLLAPKSLVVKSINGVKVTGRALVECFKVCIHL